jgi:hypothetical protein
LPLAVLDGEDVEDSPADYYTWDLSQPMGRGVAFAHWRVGHWHGTLLSVVRWLGGRNLMGDAKVDTATSVDGRPSLVGARVFVVAVFTVLAGAFLASPVLLYLEFRDHDWVTMALAHSHLFIFFPSFGLLALCAFYLPSVVFTHLYWFKLPWGRLRFLFGFAVALALTFGVTHFMLGEQASPRAIWEVAPRALDLDRGDPAGCSAARGQSCSRGAILPMLQVLRAGALKTSSLSKFGRDCSGDSLLEVPEENTKERWCFAANRKLNAEACCKAQEAYTVAVATRVANERTRSQLARWDQALQPTKIFFVLVVLVIGGMLVLWRENVERFYPDLAPRLERNVMVGGITMLLWPVMDYAYLDVSNVLFGRWTDGLQVRLSLVVGPWSLLLIFYFLRRFARRVEVIGQIVGVAGGLLAVVARDELKDWSVRLVGIGMPWWMLGVLGILLILGFATLFWPQRWLAKKR